MKNLLCSDWALLEEFGSHSAVLEGFACSSGACLDDFVRTNRAVLQGFSPSNGAVLEEYALFLGPSLKNLFSHSLTGKLLTNSLSLCGLPVGIKTTITV